MNYNDNTEPDNSSLNKNEGLSGNEIMSLLLQIIGIPVEGAFSQAMEKRIIKIANDRSKDEDLPVVDNIHDASLNPEDIERLVYLIDKDIKQDEPMSEPINVEEAKQIAAEIVEGVKQESSDESIDMLEQIRCKVQSHLPGGKGSKLNEFAQNVKQSADGRIKLDKSQDLVKNDEYKGWERSKI